MNATAGGAWAVGTGLLVQHRQVLGGTLAKARLAILAAEFHQPIADDHVVQADDRPLEVGEPANVTLVDPAARRVVDGAGPAVHRVALPPVVRVLLGDQVGRGTGGGPAPAAGGELREGRAAVVGQPLPGGVPDRLGRRRVLGTHAAVHLAHLGVARVGVAVLPGAVVAEAVGGHARLSHRNCK